MMKFLNQCSSWETLRFKHMKYITLKERLKKKELTEMQGMSQGMTPTSDISLTKYGFSYNMVDIKAGQQSNIQGVDDISFDTSHNSQEVEIDSQFRIGDKIKYKIEKETREGIIKSASKKFISVENQKSKKIDKIHIENIIDVIEK